MNDLIVHAFGNAILNEGTPGIPTEDGLFKENALLYGDINLSGDITSSDASLALQYDISLVELNASIGESKIPKRYHLEQNYPNPFNPETIIRFELPVRGKVQIDVFSLTEQKNRMLMNEEKNAGFYQLIWDGRNNTGMKVSSRVYIYRMVD